MTKILSFASLTCDFEACLQLKESDVCATPSFEFINLVAKSNKMLSEALHFISITQHVL